MTWTPHTYGRRAFLRAASATAIGVSAGGCLGSGNENHERTVLPPPEDYDRRSDIDLPYPIYDEKIPEERIPAPLHNREVATTEFVGDRHTMLTFFYTTCATVCPGLIATLHRVQADSIEEGYADEFAFLPITFDPVVDSEQILRQYRDRMGIDHEVGNWYFLRPETAERAKEVVQESFGVGFQGNGGNYDHYALILLVNKKGIVERAYNGGPPDTGTEIDDARTLVKEW